MLFLDRRRPCSPTALLLICLCLFMSVWHLITFSEGVIQDTQQQYIVATSPQQQESQQQSTIPLTYEPIIKNTKELFSSAFNIQKLPMWDYTTLIDLNEFIFDLINFPCNDSENPPLLLLLIHSALNNFDKRQVIRDTWGGFAGDEFFNGSVKRLFVLGRVKNNSTLQKAIENEEQKYHDIIQGSFIDSYRNMTYKHVTALKYAVYHCSEARYILKADDDIFVNMPLLINFLATDISPYGAHNLIYCKPIYKAQVKRSFRSKWRVSPREYPNSHYPPYCPGWAVIYSNDVAFKLYTQAQMSEYFWIDDVHITGTLVERVNLTHTVFNLTLTKQQTQKLLNNFNDDNNKNQTFYFLFASPDLSGLNIRKLWQMIQQTYSHRNNTSINDRSNKIVSFT